MVSEGFAEIKNYHYQSIIIITILKNIPVWSPSEAKGGDVKVEDPEGKMTLAKFDVNNLLEWAVPDDVLRGMAKSLMLRCQNLTT